MQPHPTAALSYEAEPLAAPLTESAEYRPTTASIVASGTCPPAALDSLEAEVSAVSNVRHLAVRPCRHQRRPVTPRWFPRRLRTGHGPSRAVPGASRPAPGDHSARCWVHIVGGESRQAGACTRLGPGGPDRAVHPAGPRLDASPGRCYRSGGFPVPDDDDLRDVLAAVSYYVGRPRPAHLPDVPPMYSPAPAYEAPYQAWVQRAAGTGSRAVEFRRFGRLLRQRAEDHGIALLTRGDHGWPAHTGIHALPCLWVRGNPDVAALLGTAITTTGARAGTDEGRHVTAEMAGPLAAHA